jgi:hypothetical protein
MWTERSACPMAMSSMSMFVAADLSWPENVGKLPLAAANHDQKNTVPISAD